MSVSERRRHPALTHAPIFFSFFTWGFGTGAQNLGRSLFALFLTGNVFLVGVMMAVNAIPRAFTGPVTGFLTDRLGRKPMVLLGPIVRGATNIGQYFADDYITFLVLEVIGQVGVAIWATSSNVLLSDVTTTENRGRMLALRTMAMRLGFVAGPAVGGVLAATFGIESVFLLNGVSKIVIVIVVLTMVRETRPEELARPGGAGRQGARLSLEPFRHRTFAVVAMATAVFAMSNAGIVQTLLPVHAVEALELDAAVVGFLISLSSTLAFLWAFPNGMIADRFGRKWSLGPGLLMMAVAAVVLTVGDVYAALLVAAVFLGMGEAMGMGTSQTFAMDLAPPEKRGMYMGLSMMANSVGATAGPLLLTGLYHFVHPDVSFVTMTVLLLLAVLLLALLAQETGGRARLQRVDAQSEP
ncbi:MAG: MFS transporter [Chloroflexota bacterium]|nr:MFS transporter [Chloroflexota bacterium]MDE2886418.1 MFS transporter [Chloroflexota bacterium]